VNPVKELWNLDFGFQLLKKDFSVELGKGKFVHEQTTKAQKGRRATLSLTSALGGVGGQRHDAAALLPRKTWYPLYRRLGGSESRSGRVRKMSPPPGFDPRTVQPVASRYTD
jgi:hypothetical protein